VKLAGIRQPRKSISSVKRTDGPFAVAYERSIILPRPTRADLTCTVIRRRTC
jgi:hypothetical protein